MPRLCFVLCFTYDIHVLLHARLHVVLHATLHVVLHIVMGRFTQGSYICAHTWSSSASLLCGFYEALGVSYKFVKRSDSYTIDTSHKRREAPTATLFGIA
jgi:hypothetical protein